MENQNYMCTYYSIVKFFKIYKIVVDAPGRQFTQFVMFDDQMLSKYCACCRLDMH